MCILGDTVLPLPSYSWMADSFHCSLFVFFCLCFSRDCMLKKFCLMPETTQVTPFFSTTSARNKSRAQVSEVPVKVFWHCNFPLSFPLFHTLLCQQCRFFFSSIFSIDPQHQIKNILGNGTLHFSLTWLSLSGQQNGSRFGNNPYGHGSIQLFLDMAKCFSSVCLWKNVVELLTDLSFS